MTKRNSLLFAFATLLSLHSYSMDTTIPAEHSLKRGLSVTDLALQPPAKKLHTQTTEPSFYLELKNHISNFETICLDKLQNTHKAEHLSKQEKEDLYKDALQLKRNLSEMCMMGRKISCQSTNKEIAEKFSFSAETKAIHKITNHLYALTMLTKTTFPQVFFTHIPGQQPKLGPTLDQIINAIIQNEQKKISVCCYHLTLSNMSNALIEQNKQGVLVDVVTNHTQGTNPSHSKEIEQMHNNRISVACPKNSAYEQMHHKFFIFDCNVFNKSLLITGSYNPTPHGNTSSWDDINIFDDAEMIAQYTQRFVEVKKRSKPYFAQM